MADLTIDDELALIKRKPQAIAPSAASVAPDPEADLPPPATDLPPPMEPADGWESMSAAWQKATIEGDRWAYSRRQSIDLTSEMFQMLSPADQADIRQRMTLAGSNAHNLPSLVIEAAARDAAASAEAAAKWGQYPTTQKALDARIRAEAIRDREEAQSVLNQPGGEFSEFLGSSARAITTPASVAATFAGAFTGGTGAAAWRIIASEAALNSAAEGVDAMTEAEIARQNGWAEPDVSQRMLFGAVLGGGLSGLVIGGAKLASKFQGRRSSALAATPDGADGIGTEIAIDAAEAKLRGEETPQQTLADAAEAGTLGRIVTSGDQPAFTTVQEAGSGYTVVIGADGQTVRREGTRAWRNNNPGNIEYGPFARSMGAIGTDGRFAVFPTYEAGRAAKASLLWASKGYRGKTIGEAISRYAPSFENNTRAYTGAITRALGVTADTPMSALTPGQREVMMDAMERVEGFRPGKENGVQAKAPRKGISTPTADEDMPTFETTSRGYTGSGQVKVGDDMTIDVEYEVMDIDQLVRASGPYQPRDRSRINSDAWIADTAARLDPAQLMPSPTADRGAPIIGPDNMIESGNGRFSAIARAYERHPDRAAQYKGAIEAAGYTVPEGVNRPVLVARRKTELDDAARQRLTVAAQDSGVAVMTPTEMAQVAARTLTPERLDRMDMRVDITAPENDAFLRAFMEAMPRSQRNAMSDGDGGLNGYGRRHLREALFARAWGDPDIIELMTEGQRGDLKGLFDALENSAPAWAALKADIEAGRVLPEMDISGHVLDAMRMIATARRIAARDKQPLAKALDDLLNSPDMIDGALAPLTAALLRKFWKGGRAAPEDEVTGFLTRYADDARKAGQSGGLFDAPTPRDILAAIDRNTFGDLPDDLGPVRGFARPTAQVAPPPQAYADGAASAEVQAIDQAIRETMDFPDPDMFQPPEISASQADLLERAQIAATSGNAANSSGFTPYADVAQKYDIIELHDPSEMGLTVPSQARLQRLKADLTLRVAPDVWAILKRRDAQSSGDLAETIPTPAPDAIQAELAATRRTIGDEFADLEFDLEGTGKIRIRDFLSDLDADAGHAAAIRACAITPKGAT